MPALLTHYACGVKAYHTLSDGYLKRAVRHNIAVYTTGLAGPDLFFYSVFEIFRSQMNMGRALHKYRTGLFLHHLLDEALSFQGKEREIALAYYAGFVGHYCLDSKTHALVYRLCHDPSKAKALGKHFRYEAAMDVISCRTFLGRDICHSHQMGLIRLKRVQMNVISVILTRAARKTFGRELSAPSVLRMKLILTEYYLISGLLIDPSGFKEWCLLHFEMMTRGYPHASSLFVNSNLYGVKKEQWDRFRTCFDEGVSMFEKCLKQIEQVFAGPESRRAYEDLLRLIGSRSYHGFYHDEASCSLPLDELVRRQEEREKHYH